MDQLQEKQKAIIDHYGIGGQLDILVEECSELIQAICKFKRYETSPVKISSFSFVIEEMADVENVIEQLKMSNKTILARVKTEKNIKVNRQIERISQELQDAGLEELSKELDCKFNL